MFRLESAGASNTHPNFKEHIMDTKRLTSSLAAAVLIVTGTYALAAPAGATETDDPSA